MSLLWRFWCSTRFFWCRVGGRSACPYPSGTYRWTSVGCPGGLSLSQTVLELVLFPELYPAPSDGDCVEKGSISERLLGLCLTETELGRNKQITVSRVRSCSLGQNHSGQQPELSVDQGGSSWHGRDEREQAHTSSPAPLPRWTLLSPDYLQAPQLSPWIFPPRRQSL